MPTQFKQVANNAISSTNTDLSAAGVTLIAVAAGEGSKFPTPGNGYFFTLWNGVSPSQDPNVESVVVTARNGDSLTTTATQKVHASPCNVGLLDNGGNIVELQVALNAAETAAASLAARVTVLESNQGGGSSTPASANFTFAAAVATANVDLTSTTVIAVDGYTLNAGDVVLLSGQTDAKQNGLYTVGSGTSPSTWTRTTAFATGTIVKGWLAIISNGNSYVGSQWALLTPTAGVTVGTGTQTWSILGTS